MTLRSRFDAAKEIYNEEKKEQPTKALIEYREALLTAINQYAAGEIKPAQGEDKEEVGAEDEKIIAQILAILKETTLNTKESLLLGQYFLQISKPKEAAPLFQHILDAKLDLTVSENRNLIIHAERQLRKLNPNHVPQILTLHLEFCSLLGKEMTAAITDLFRLDSEIKPESFLKSAIEQFNYNILEYTPNLRIKIMETVADIEHQNKTSFAAQLIEHGYHLISIKDKNVYLMRKALLIRAAMESSGCISYHWKWRPLQNQIEIDTMRNKLLLIAIRCIKGQVSYYENQSPDIKQLNASSGQPICRMFSGLNQIIGIYVKNTGSRKITPLHHPYHNFYTNHCHLLHQNSVNTCFNELEFFRSIFFLKNYKQLEGQKSQCDLIPYVFREGDFMYSYVNNPSGDIYICDGWVELLDRIILHCFINVFSQNAAYVEKVYDICLVELHKELNLSLPSLKVYVNTNPLEKESKKLDAYFCQLENEAKNLDAYFREHARTDAEYRKFYQYQGRFFPPGVSQIVYDFLSPRIS